MVLQRSELIRHNQTDRWTKLPRIRVQLPNSHPDEYQWQFTVDAESDAWTDGEMTPVEEALIEHMEPWANAAWEFCKMFGKVDVTRLNWRFSELLSMEDVVPYINRFYVRQKSEKSKEG